MEKGVPRRNIDMQQLLGEKGLSLLFLLRKKEGKRNAMCSRYQKLQRRKKHHWVFRESKYLQLSNISKTSLETSFKLCDVLCEMWWSCLGNTFFYT